MVARIKFTNIVKLATVSSMLVLSSLALAEALPSIQQRVDQYNQTQSKNTQGPKLTEQDMALMQKASADIAASLPEPGLRVGTKAPDFTLGNANGKQINLYDQLQQGPVVLIFYRGAWCPYCNIQLHALQESVPAFKKYNAQIITITPQTPDKSLAQVSKDNYPFEILSDLNDEVSKTYRLYFDVPVELHEFYKSKFKLDIEAYNGKGRLGLPVPGSFVIDKDGTIVAAFADHDYKKRMEPQAIVEALDTIK